MEEGPNVFYDILTCDGTWIYQYDPETKSQSSIFPGEDPPVKVGRARSVGKKMVAAFFCKTGPVTIVPLEDRRTVNADWYIDNCLPKAFEAWSSRRPKTASEAYSFTTIMHRHTLQPRHWTSWLKIQDTVNL